MSETVLEVKQVAKRLGVSSGTVRKLCESGALRNAWVSGAGSKRKHWRIPASDVENYLARRGKNSGERALR